MIWGAHPYFWKHPSMFDFGWYFHFFYHGLISLVVWQHEVWEKISPKYAPQKIHGNVFFLIKINGSCRYIYIYLHIYLEPQWPLFLKVNPPNKTRVIWVLGIYIYTRPMMGSYKLQNFYSLQLGDATFFSGAYTCSLPGGADATRGGWGVPVGRFCKASGPMSHRIHGKIVYIPTFRWSLW